MNAFFNIVFIIWFAYDLFFLLLVVIRYYGLTPIFGRDPRGVFLLPLPFPAFGQLYLATPFSKATTPV
jgi:hypothetical protein